MLFWKELSYPFGPLSPGCEDPLAAAAPVSALVAAYAPYLEFLDILNFMILINNIIIT